jgi:hypothetical protein
MNDSQFLGYGQVPFIACYRVCKIRDSIISQRDSNGRFVIASVRATVRLRPAFSQRCAPAPVIDCLNECVTQANHTR